MKITKKTIISSSKTQYNNAYSMKDLSNLQQYHLNMFSALFSFFIKPGVSLFTSTIMHIFGNNSSNDFNDSKRFKLILWSIVGATRGGPNRARILNLIITESLNSYQIAKKLNLTHKTIRHHLKILVKNQLIAKSSEKSYGAEYVLTPIMEKNISSLKEIVSKLRNEI